VPVRCFQSIKHAGPTAPTQPLSLLRAMSVRVTVADAAPQLSPFTFYNGLTGPSL
jgi:hypothetical protein